MLKIEKNNLHLYKAKFKIDQYNLKSLWESLSQNEKRRASQFIFSKDKMKFIFTRGLLRKVLASYLGLSPKQLRFNYQAHGKPEIHPSQNKSCIQFNVSHSKNGILFAITNGMPVGIDIEYCRKDIDFLPIAKNFFHEDENVLLNQLESAQKELAFFYIWTQKEAILKAQGIGLTQQLSKLHESINLMKQDEMSFQWHIKTFMPFRNYYAAIATIEKIETVTIFNL
jgi:4'-phosphopantetheinyl transferase